MRNPPTDDDDLDPAAARMVAKVRGLMLIAGLTTMVAIAAVLGVIGYRVFTLQGSGTTTATAPADVSASLPKGARVISTAAAGDRIVVTVEIGGQVEIRTFDLHSLKLTGRLRFSPEP